MNDKLDNNEVAKKSHDCMILIEVKGVFSLVRWNSYCSVGCLQSQRNI